MQGCHEERDHRTQPRNIGKQGEALALKDRSYLVHRGLPCKLTFCSHRGENLSRTFCSDQVKERKVNLAVSQTPRRSSVQINQPGGA